MITVIERKHTNARMSKWVRHAGVVYLCGQTSNGTDIADIAGQTREVLQRIDTLLAEAGTDKARLLAATIYLRDAGDFATMNAEWEAWMPSGHAPARTTVEARCAGPGLLVEITVTAAA
jgi:enamine deaminase RidA (YjgF/YER057c/UK114 family)